MPKNYWMFVQTPEEFETSKGLGFTLHGLKSRHRRRAQRMEPDDRVLFYVNGIRKWAVSGSVASRYFEDRTPIWNSNGNRDEFPYRVKLSPAIILEEKDYIDARELGPRLDYVKRWVPERWPLAFIDTLHLLPQRDFRLIEGEMKRIVRKGRKRRRNRRPDRDVAQRVDGAVEAGREETSVGQTETTSLPDDVAVGAVGGETSVAQTEASAPPDDAAGEAVRGEMSVAQTDASAPPDDVAGGAAGEETSVAQTDASAPPDDAAGEAVRGEMSVAQTHASAPPDDAAGEAVGGEASAAQADAPAPPDDVAGEAVGGEASAAQADAPAPPDDVAGEAVGGEASAAQADASAPPDDAVEDTGPEAVESDVQPARQDHEQPESGPEGDGSYSEAAGSETGSR